MMDSSTGESLRESEPFFCEPVLLPFIIQIIIIDKSLDSYWKPIQWLRSRSAHS